MSTDSVALSDLVATLWGLFKPDIKSGHPVFFSFSRESLSPAFQSDAHRRICDAANSLLVVHKNSVELKPEALSANHAGFTASIVLVAQQILAVEEMVDDPSGFSENAYFPRLRKMISPALSEVSANPFNFEEFESIWRSFASEIRSFNKSTEASITFRFGDETGANKAKGFPLSQALLTQENLLTLVRMMGQKAVLLSPPEVLWRGISNESAHLGRRARRLLAINYLRPRVVDQLRAFAKAIAPGRLDSAQARTISAESLALGVFRESIDWMTEEFRPCLYRNGDLNSIEDCSIIRQHIEELLDSVSSISMPLGEFGDCWIRSSIAVPVKQGDIFVVVSRVGGQNKVRAQETSLLKYVEVIETKPLAGLSEFEVSECRVLPSARSDIVIVRDRIATRNFPVRVDHEWIGGVCLNRRSSCYLREALPTKIQLSDRIFSIGDLVAINKIPFTYKRFVEMLANEQTEASFEVEFPDGGVASISIGIRRGIFDERLGFSVSTEEKIAPFVDWIPPHGRALIGHEEPTIARTADRNLQICIDLIDRLQRQGPESIDGSQFELIDALVSSASLPVSVKRLLSNIKSIATNGKPSITMVREQ